MSSLTGWRFRGYLPHYDDGLAWQCLTYRLRDALPSAVVAQLKEAADHGDTPAGLIDRYLDAGHGSCVLRQKENAEIVLANWHHFDGRHYRLHAWAIMPNHVHVLIEPNGTRQIAAIVRSWKSYTAKRIAAASGTATRLWQPDYYDRFIRNHRHYLAAVEYIHQNPVRAGLCRQPEDWPWSSARMGARAAHPP